jgi:TolA-binding protein
MSAHLSSIDRRARVPRSTPHIVGFLIDALRCSALMAGVLCTGVTALADEPAGTGQPAGAGASEMSPSVLLDDLESGAREKQARLVRLRLQLQRLAEENRRAREQVQPPEPEPDAAKDTPPPPAPEADLEPLMPELAPNDPHAVPAPPVEEPAHPADAAHGDAAVPPQSGAAAHTAETLAGASINRLALGDSLFGTGQTELALQAYSNIELTKVAAVDRYWIEYQIANCHRRLGNVPEAQQRYRKLAGLVDAGWCAGHARWWLDALATRSELQKNLEAVKHSLKSMEEQLNAEPAK